MGAWGLAWRLYRFELGSMLLAIGLLAIAGFLITMRLDEIRPAPDRVSYCRAYDPVIGREPDCPDVAEWFSRREEEAFRIFGTIPFVAGIILGSVLVSRELESRTAQLGWSLSGARRRWLIERIVPVVVPLMVVLSGLALAGDALEGARWPTIDPRASLHQYGERGLPLVMRGLAAFSGSVLIGSIVGRQLPALILSGVLALAIGSGLVTLFPYGAAWQWVPYREAMSDDANVAYRFDREAFRLPDGRIVTYQEALELVPHGTPDADQWVWDNIEAVHWVLRGDRLSEIEQREALILGAGAVLALGASLVVVGRRRPY